MGWSISPNDTASINETTGVASFSENTEATDKKYTVTYTDEYGCSNSLEYTVPKASSTCELIVSSAESPDTIFPCDGGEITGWACYYEVITTTAGVTSKTAEGSAIATFTVGGNCDGTERELDIEQSSASSLIIDELDDDGTDILMEYSNCAVSGKFKQEGKPDVDVIIRGCDELTWYANGDTSSNSRTYNHIAPSGTFLVYPKYNGNNIYCIESNVEFYTNGYTAFQDAQGNWVTECVCCSEPQPCIGAFSGYTSSTEAYLTETVLQGSTFVTGFHNASLNLDSSQSSYNQVTLNYSTTSPDGKLIDDVCNVLHPGEPLTPVGIGCLISFTFYKNQTKQSGETLTCLFDVYYNLATPDV